MIYQRNRLYIGLLLFAITIAAQGQLDSAAFVPKNAPISYQEAYTKPEFEIPSENPSTLASTYFLKSFMEMQIHLGRKFKARDSVYTHYYFEISPEMKIENLKAESTYPLNEVIIEYFFETPPKVVAPARDSLGNPIRSFWYHRFEQAFPSYGIYSLDKLWIDREDLKIRQVGDHTFRHISFLQAEKYGRVACNGLVVIRGDEALVIDTPVDPEVSRKLLKILKLELALDIVGVVATHFHEDCLGGLEAFHEWEVKSYGTAQTRAMAEKKGQVPPQAEIDADHTFYVGGEPVQVAWFGPGHTADNIVVYDPMDQVLFGGCLVKADGAGKGNLADADVKAWPETIRKIIETYPEVEVVVPGHGSPGGKKLLEYTLELFQED